MTWSGSWAGWHWSPRCHSRCRRSSSGSRDGDPAVAWAAYLPQFAFIGLLFHALALAALAADERRPSAWLRIVVTATALVMVAPILIFGAGITGLADPAELVRFLVYVMAVWLLFNYASRPWAGAPPVDESIGRPKPR